ncbi:50S ribosomal protein L32 [Eremococcus coleocola]|uniref:Large ribosomal subunit protein bL32 n=1 Tax=Eremococcus coleocola ACS-139-V-Col8 TaxID=908337 RepID=E4KPB4_9LACT|nr:50S ribosomal protein L32 [Eremococcus coleocola]EFR31192.1 ribosomal protein L32 [Eremococcus coleocola ACS-139-V-Col8]
MAVPKRKTSKAKKRSRRGGKGLSVPNVSFDPTTGEYRMSHRVDANGNYNGRQVIEK